MNKCTECGSYAINHHCHGRDGSDPELCDVCYWRVRATDYATLEAECERLRRDRDRANEFANTAVLARDAMAAELAAIKGQELDGWRLVPVEPTAEMLAAAWEAPIPAVWLDSIRARDNLVQSTKYRAMLAAAPSMPDAQVAPVGKHAHLYECTGCGGMYLEKVSQCDCMPDVQQFNEWVAYPKRASAS